MKIDRVEDVAIGATVMVGHVEAMVVGRVKASPRDPKPTLLSLNDGRLVDPAKTFVKVVAFGSWRAGSDRVVHDEDVATLEHAR